uniref:Uncharacterized protein n=1 Tax=Cacopsylla melanoneura TaxID=428564 RepID=A0A8D9B5S4_9HEMI
MQVAVPSFLLVASVIVVPSFLWVASVIVLVLVPLLRNKISWLTPDFLVFKGLPELATECASNYFQNKPLQLNLATTHQSLFRMLRLQYCQTHSALPFRII